MKYNPKYPLKHLSIRVPWHDNRWNGTVCKNAKNNDSCLVLSNCATNRKDEQEMEFAGMSLKVLNEQQYPACVSERGTFMAGFAFDRTIIHPYSKNKKGPYKYFAETILTQPAYSSPAVPFNSMLPEYADQKAKLYELDFDAYREPYYRYGEANSLAFTKTWI